MSTSGRMLDWLDRDLAWKRHGRPLCAICGAPAEFVLFNGKTWHRLRHLRPGVLSGNERCQPQCVVHWRKALNGIFEEEDALDASKGSP